MQTHERTPSNHTYFKLSSVLDMTFNSSKYEELYQNRKNTSNKKSIRNAYFLIFGLNILTMIYLIILKLSTSIQIKHNFCDYCIDIVFDSIILSIFLYFETHLANTNSNIILIFYAQLLVPFQAFSGSVQVYFRLSVDYLFPIVAVEFLVRLLFILYCKCSFKDIMKSTTLILFYQWIIILWFHNSMTRTIINYMVLYTLVYISLCVIAFLKEKFARLSFINNIRRHEQKILIGSSMDYLKIGILSIHQKYVQFNKVIQTISESLRDNRIKNISNNKVNVNKDKDNHNDDIIYNVDNYIYGNSDTDDNHLINIKNNTEFKIIGREAEANLYFERPYSFCRIGMLYIKLILF